MKVVYFDCPSGASGDMILGALVDVGVSLDALRGELAKLGLAGWRLSAREVRRGGVRGAEVGVGVWLDGLRGELAKRGLAGWRLSAREVRRGAFRATKVDVEIEGGAHHQHRNLGDIVGILEGSGLPRAVVDGAARVFRRLAE